MWPPFHAHWPAEPEGTARAYVYQLAWQLSQPGMYGWLDMSAVIQGGRSGVKDGRQRHIDGDVKASCPAKHEADDGTARIRSDLRYAGYAGELTYYRDAQPLSGPGLFRVRSL